MTGFIQFRRFFTRGTRGVEDFVQGTEGHENQRKLVYKIIDDAPFQKWVVFVAGCGFLTDAFDIFALNIVIPIISLVYYDGAMPHSYQTALLCTSLAGTIVGQIIFGILGDLWGRKKMYGFELGVVLFATLGVTMSSEGAQGSMSLLGWLLFWRLMMGIGIGADYPLSAVITSEFAPRRHRLRMLAIVFFTQPLGQLFATIVSVVVIKASEAGIPQHFATCSTPSQAFVEPSSDCCTHIVANSNLRISEDCVRTLDRAWRWVAGFGALPAVVAIAFRFTIPESPRYRMDVAGQVDDAVHDTKAYFPSQQDDIGNVEDQSASHYEKIRQIQQSPLSPARLLQVPDAGSHIAQIVPDSDPRNNASIQGYANQGDETSETAVDGVSLSHDQLPGAWDYFIREGNWQYLFGTAMAWLLLDIPFYGLGLSYSSIVQEIWTAKPSQATENDIHQHLMDTVTHQLIIVSVGAVLGGLIAIKIIKHVSPKTIQMWGFLAVGVLLIVTGSAFTYILGPGLVVLYVLIQLFFNLGPNTTTFIAPAELFPTRYRCTCHGISAAAGKIGSIAAQLFLAYVKFDGKGTINQSASSWLGHVLQVFCAFMVVGAAITRWLIPNTVDASGQSRSLEVLSKGKKYLDELGSATAPEDIELDSYNGTTS